MPNLHRRTADVAAVAALLLAPAAGGCDVDWQGAWLRVETPPPGGRAGPADTASAEPSEPSLPERPLLYFARVRGDRAVLLPVARLRNGRPARLRLPPDPSDAWLARFDSTFYPPGRRLALHGGGERIGSLHLTGRGLQVEAGCPPAAVARPLVLPGQGAPTETLAVPPRRWTSGIDARPRPEVSDRVRRFAPILAERLLTEAGVPRPYLARAAAVTAVSFPGSRAPGVAATYLIRDTLAAAPARDSAASLFYLARFDPARGYAPVWSRIRRYSGAEKAAYSHVEAAAGPGGRPVHLLRAYGPESVRLAVLWSDAGGRPTEVAWKESGPCDALRITAAAQARLASGPAPGGRTGEGGREAGE